MLLQLTGMAAGIASEIYTHSAFELTSEYKMYDPAPEKKEKGLILYLHGDNTSDYHSDQLWGSIKKEASKTGAVAVSAKALPCYMDKQWQNRWWYCAEENAKYLDSLLTTLSKEHGIDKKKILFSGQSGGSTFLGGYFFPKFGDQYGGHALLGCPGYLLSAQPKNAFSKAPATNSLTVHVLTTGNDYLKKIYGPGAKRLAERYKTEGYPVNFEEEPGRNHCDFKEPFSAYLGRAAQALFKEGGVTDEPNNSEDFTIHSRGTAASTSTHSGVLSRRSTIAIDCAKCTNESVEKRKTAFPTVKDPKGSPRLAPTFESMPK